MSKIMMFILCVLFPFILKTQAIRLNPIKILNNDVWTEIDISGHPVEVKYFINFINEDAEDVGTYLFAVNESEPFYIKFFDNEQIPLQYEKLNFTHFEVLLRENVNPQKNTTIKVEVTFGNKISPATPNRAMNEDQLMKFIGNLLFYSPYETRFLKIVFLTTRSVIEISKDPEEIRTDRILYSFENVGKYAFDPIEIIFVNNKPFLVVKNLERTIDVSHFGKISFEDVVHVTNFGAKLVGHYIHHFSEEKISGTDWLYTHLPASAEHIKLFDNIGNSSRSQVYNFIQYVTLKFKPRYPLLGGWKTFYILQYQVPTHEYLFTTPSNLHILKVRGIDFVLNNALIEEAMVKIVLPEGARVESIDVPEGLKVVRQETSCRGGLCVHGKPTIVLSGRNLFEAHIAPVDVQYFFNPWLLLRAPLLLSCYCQACFSLYLILNYLFAAY